MLFDAVLFDLDGVLVDTEAIVGKVWAEVFSGQGLDLGADEITRLTSGQRFEGVLAQLEQQRGWKAPEDFLPLLEDRFNGAFNEVPALPGARETLLALQAAGVPFAVASNSEKGRLHLKLRGAGLAEVVGTHAYDPSLVGGKGKPNPALYLYAAEQLRVPINRCLVIEDSVPGARAGIAAGATVWALLAGTHILEGDAGRLLVLGAERVLPSHAALLTTLGLSYSFDK